MPAEARRGPGRALWLALVACVALGVFFRAYHLDRKAYWEDEMLGTMRMLGYTEASVVEASPRITRAADVQAFLRLPADRSKDRLGNTVVALAAEDPQHPPAYYLLGHLWAEAFGTSLAAIRGLPALFGVLALPCVFWLALELFESKLTAAIALGLVALSPVFVLYAQEAREYSLWTVAIALACIAFLRALRRPSLRNWSAYCACLVAGLYVYPLTALVAVGHGLYLACKDGPRLTRAGCAYLGAVLVAGLAFAPWIATMLHGQGVSKGMSGIANGKLSPGTRAVSIAHIFSSPFADFSYIHEGAASTARNGLFTLLACALAVYALYSLRRTQPFRVWGFVLAGLVLPALPFMFFSGFVYQTRYFTPLLLGVILATAALFAQKLTAPATARRGSVAWGAGLATLAAVQVLSCYRSSQADTWWNKAAERSRAVATIVNQARTPIVISRHFVPSVLSLTYYLDPDVPLRVDLQCSQCSVEPPPREDLLANAGPHAEVFDLDLPDAVPPNKGIRVIDPRPFPPRGVALTMFQRALQ